MPKRYDKRVRERAEELFATGLSAKEVERRIKADTAGLGEKIDIGYRSVAKWAAEWRVANGPALALDEEALSEDSKRRIRLRALALFQREVTYHEKQRPGSMTAAKARDLKGIVDCAETVQKKLGPKSSKTSKRSPGAKAESGSALRSLAEQMAQAPARIDAPFSTDTKPPENKTDSGNGRASGAQGGESQPTQQAPDQQRRAESGEQERRALDQAGRAVKPEPARDQASKTSGPGWPE